MFGPEAQGRRQCWSDKFGDCDLFLPLKPYFFRNAHLVSHAPETAVVRTRAFGAEVCILASKNYSRSAKWHSPWRGLIIISPHLASTHSGETLYDPGELSDLSIALAASAL